MGSLIARASELAAQRRRPDLPVAPGERLLAWARLEDGSFVGGTREAAYLPQRLPWQQVQAADWDRESELLSIAEVGDYGAERVVHSLAVSEPGRFLELLRERVTATVAMQWHVPVEGRRGLRVVARRAPSGERAITWVYEYDEGVDPADPQVAALARETLAQARLDLGEV